MLFNILLCYFSVMIVSELSFYFPAWSRLSNPRFSVSDSTELPSIFAGNCRHVQDILFSFRIYIWISLCGVNITSGAYQFGQYKVLTSQIFLIIWRACRRYATLSLQHARTRETGHKKSRSQICVLCYITVYKHLRWQKQTTHIRPT